MEKSPIVFFDLGNTLVKIKDELLTYCVLLLGQEGWNAPQIFGVKVAIKRFKKAEMNEWNQIPAEKINIIKTDQQEFEFWVEFYQSVAKTLGISNPSDNLTTTLASIPMDPNSFDLFSDVSETLEVLRHNNITMGIISNAFPSANLIIKDLGLKELFKYIVLSYENEFLPKPHPQIYEFAVKQAEIKENYPVLFIDDRPSFVVGATKANVGISAMLIDREFSAPTGPYERITSLGQIPVSLGIPSSSPVA